MGTVFFIAKRNHRTRGDGQIAAFWRSLVIAQSLQRFGGAHAAAAFDAEADHMPIANVDTVGVGRNGKIGQFNLILTASESQCQASSELDRRSGAGRASARLSPGRATSPALPHAEWRKRPGRARAGGRVTRGDVTEYVTGAAVTGPVC